MLSYLHSFHAGNFADVLKHLVSVEILKHISQKEAPFFYLDTHSGSGAYQLSSKEALKTSEYLNGIGSLWENHATIPSELNDYFDQVIQFNHEKAPPSELKRYPGSPWFAKQYLRTQDRAVLCELHPKVFDKLRLNFSGNRKLKCYKEDGFEACNRLLPPTEKRGFILIDPPYEVKTDYQTVINTLIKSHRKFTTGIYALWYPVVQRYRINEMEQALINSGINNIQIFELGIQKDSEKGMTSSGMLVINPPWTLKRKMEQVLPVLTKQLAPNTGRYRAEQLVEEA